MAGYIGKSQGVTQVDGYNRTEADDRYVNASGDTMTGTLSVTGVDRNEDALRVGASSAGTGYGLRIGASGATDPLEIWREHSSGDQMQLSVDYYGRVTMPYQPAFSAYGNSSNYSIPSAGTFIVLPYSSYNQGGHYSTSTGRFTAPVTGWYEFGFFAYMQGTSSTGYTRIFIYKNDVSAELYSINPPTAYAQSISTVVQVYLAANDFVSVAANCDSGTASMYTGYNHTGFYGRLLG